MANNIIYTPHGMTAYSSKTSTQKHQLSNKVQGFTLIELVLMIAILGVLSAMALPRFADLSNHAQRNVIIHTAGVMKSLSGIVHTKAMITGNSEGLLDIGGVNVAVRSGYIRGHWNDSFRKALNLRGDIGSTSPGAICKNNNLCGVGYRSEAPGLPFDTNGIRGLVLIWPEGSRLSDLCYVYYFNPQDGSSPVIGSVINGC